MNISEIELICGEIPIDHKKEIITGSDYIIDSCKNELVSIECLNDYENQ